MKQIKRKCIGWFLSLEKEHKDWLFEEVSFKICVYLKQGNSINLSKAMVRNEMGLGYKLIDHLARSSMQVLQLKKLMK